MKRRRDFYFSIKYIVLSLSVICLFLMVLTYAKGETVAVYKNALVDAFSPIQTGITSIEDWFKDQSQKRVEKEELLKKIEQLQAENDALYGQIEEFQTDYLELNELRSLFALYNEYEQYEMIGAKVIAKESGSWFHKFTINRGLEDGIKLDMNVIAKGGLCGIVTDVGAHTATVTSILDDQMNVSGVTKHSRISCMVMGDLEAMADGHIRIMYVNKDATINDFEKIVTSQTSSKYLPDLLIGYAVDVTLDANSLSQSGYLIPAVDFDHLETVLVITNTKNVKETK